MAALSRSCSYGVALLIAMPLVLAGVASAAIDDYEFKLDAPVVKMGDAVVSVRIVNKSTGAAVPDAVIFAKRLDMAPEGMATMTADLEVLPSDQPGVYRFRTNFTMEGGWQLSLAAKIQGETGSLQTRLRLDAKD
jgi:hypothetical protein